MVRLIGFEKYAEWQASVIYYPHHDMMETPKHE
jgi:hypothetical protein